MKNALKHTKKSLKIHENHRKELETIKSLKNHRKSQQNTKKLKQTKS